jgi:hypothetical protein
VCAPGDVVQLCGRADCQTPVCRVPCAKQTLACALLPGTARASDAFRCLCANPADPAAAAALLAPAGADLEVALPEAFARCARCSEVKVVPADAAAAINALPAGPCGAAGGDDAAAGDGDGDAPPGYTCERCSAFGGDHLRSAAALAEVLGALWSPGEPVPIVSPCCGRIVIRDPHACDASVCLSCTASGFVDPAFCALCFTMFPDMNYAHAHSGHFGPPGVPVCQVPGAVPNHLRYAVGAPPIRQALHPNAMVAEAMRSVFPEEMIHDEQLAPVQEGFPSQGADAPAIPDPGAGPYVAGDAGVAAALQAALDDEDW